MVKPNSDTKKKSDAATPEAIVIKKYANRRLYNTDSSKYIVQQDVIDMINSGVSFSVEDAKTGEDITRAILNQIIFEQETQDTDFLLPLEFQKQLIRMYNDTYSHMIPDFLTQSITYFAQERSQMTKVWQEMMAQNTDSFVKYSQKLALQNMDMFRKTWDVFDMMKPTQETEKTPKSEPTDGLDKIQEQIDALQSQLQSMKR
ncbi:MAG: polyhydroxyalkanoate synthesis repressor PhaR [Amylibacter sp.]|nr:polyhydroxyalkanoate synthesis repressor PhaR [Amylibacter sp.]